MAWALYTRQKNVNGDMPGELPKWEYRGDRHDLESLYVLSSRFDWQVYDFGVRHTKMSGAINVNPNPETIEVMLYRLPLDLDGSWDDYALPGAIKFTKE